MLELKPPLAPMEAKSVDDIPAGDGWQYEPKWDGFRCLAFRDGDDVYLQSKSEKPLARYFPEMVDAILAIKAKRFVLDGELVVPVGVGFDFDQLLQRIHPAASRIEKLSRSHPARYQVFDLLADRDGSSLLRQSLDVRRSRLETFAERGLTDDRIRLSPATTSLKQARQWYRRVGATTDGLIAKRLSAAYLPGDRSGAMQKIKPARTADCVVGGFRYGSKSRVVGSLLLGLYDDVGLLHHVGFTSNLPRSDRENLTKRLEALVKPPGFTGNAPGGPSRWSTERSTEWQPLAPSLVVEVAFNHVTANRFRHGASFLRWRPDKSPKKCTIDQLRLPG